MESEKFYSMYKAGKVELDEIHDYVDRWHEDDFEGEIYEYLGMTRDQYIKWVMTGQLE